MRWPRGSAAERAEATEVLTARFIVFRSPGNELQIFKNSHSLEDSAASGGTNLTREFLMKFTGRGGGAPTATGKLKKNRGKPCIAYDLGAS